MTLNGPSRIYHVKPVFQLPTRLQTSSPMYKMRNLHEQPAVRSCASGSTLENHNENNESKMISDVLRRQEELIKHLQNIQTKVTDLKLELTSTSRKEQTSSKDTVDGGKISKAKKPLKTVSNNISTKSSKDAPINLKNVVVKNPVINLSPYRPAYSLLTLSHIWSNVFKDNNLHMHIHSSVNEMPKAFRKSKRPVAKEDKENSVFDMRLIWKDVPETELISSPIKHSPLLGEVSLLRLFQRMFTSQVSSVEEVIAVDSALDVCHQLLYTNEKHTALGLVKKLAEILGSNEWMLGSPHLSIVDAAAWSAVLNVSHLVQHKQLGPNLAKWTQKINSLVGITHDMIE